MIRFFKGSMDNASGKVSDKRFSKLSKAYEAKQRDLTDRAKALQTEFDGIQEKAVNVEQFFSLVKSTPKWRN